MTEQNTPEVNDETTTGGAGTKPRRRRATRPAAPVAAATEATATDETAAPGADAAPAANDEATAAPAGSADDAAPAEAPAAPRRRATRSRKAAAEPPAPVEPVAEDEAAEETAEEVVVEEVVEPEAVEAVQPEAVSTPRLATTAAVLFQAPDLSQVRPRRRRVTATAGSPEEISQATRHEVAAEPAEDMPLAELAPEVAEAVEGPATGQSRSRSRSRRGRGGRGGAARPQGPAADQAEELAPADEAEELEHEDVEEVEGEETAGSTPRRRRRRGGRGRRGRVETGEVAAEGAEPAEEDEEPAEDDEATDVAEEGAEGATTTRRRRRRRRGTRPEGTTTEAEPRRRDEVTALRGSTRLEAKRQRRREGRDAGRRRQIITEAEFLARRESVDRVMAVRERGGRTQIAVLEDGVLVEHYVSDQAAASMVGNVYLGRVQNVLPSMEAAFVDVGKGRNAVLYAGEVNWDAAGLEGQPRRIEQALRSGDSVLVQVTKDPIGHKGARLTSQVTLAGRYLVYVPGGGMTGISRKLPDTERNRLKKILRDIVPDSAGVIVRTAAEGASEEELQADIARLTAQWEAIEKKSKSSSAPALLQGEPDMAIRVVRDIFNDDFSKLVVQGDEAWPTISSYVSELAPDLAARVSKWSDNLDVFTVHRVDEQLSKGMDRKVWLPSGGSLVIDRTEAMTVIDVNTGKFTGAGGTLEETVTRNNLEAAEEIVRQLRLRDIGGIIVIDFIDMVLESNRDLVLRRLVECLGRDRTKHQVAEVTSLGLVQMTRKRVGQGLVEAFSETCEHCHGRGFIVHNEPVERTNGRPEAGGGNHAAAPAEAAGKRSRRKRTTEPSAAPMPVVPVLPEAREAVKATLATIAAAAAHAHEHDLELEHEHEHPAEPVAEEHARLDVLAELAAHLPVGERHAAAPPDEAALASLAEIAAHVAADETEPVVNEEPEVADEAAVEPETAVEGGDELGLAPVDPALFDEPDDATEESSEDDEEGPDEG